MTKYITNVKGGITGIVQGDGAQAILQDGKIITPRLVSRRLVKCRKCGKLVPDAPYCIECGAKL